MQSSIGNYCLWFIKRRDSAWRHCHDRPVHRQVRQESGSKTAGLSLTIIELDLELMKEHSSQSSLTLEVCRVGLQFHSHLHHLRVSLRVSQMISLLHWNAHVNLSAGLPDVW